MIRHSHSVYVSVANRYWNSQWSREQNFKVYGQQASSEGVGGNWRVEISATPETHIASLAEKIKRQLDHRCLWLDTAVFQHQASTLERVCEWLARDLGNSVLTIHESERVACRIQPGMKNLSLRMKVNNLQLECCAPVNPDTGLVESRVLLTHEVMELLKQEPMHSEPRLWAESLFTSLKTRVKSLSSLRIDLSLQRYIELNLNPLL